MAPSQDGSFELNCLIYGESIVFPVFAGHDLSIGRLKNEIKKERALGTLRDVDPHTLNLWKPKDSNLIKARPADTLVERIRDMGDGLSNFADELDPTDRLSSIFSIQPLSECVHIIVKAPVTATISPSSSNESNRSSAPIIYENWSPRRDTVRRLYDVLIREKLVHVRGTPGCGKTTLMDLLHAFILDQEPSAFVNAQLSWPPKESGASLSERLRKVDPAFPRRDGLAYLLFDEGQDSYEDKSLWNGFLKRVCDGGYPSYRVIMFCSYGSPSVSPVPDDIHKHPAPLVLHDAALISLWPREGSIGILLNRSEFDDVVFRFQRKLNLHRDLQDLIFQWTVGHAGAVIQMLDTISYQRVKEARRGEQFTVEIFHRENPTHDLVRRLSRGAFGRGLPTSQILSTWPDVVALFKNLLKNGMIVKNGENDEAIRECHRSGWIHAEQDEKYTYYTFPSPLHAVCVSWRLEPTNEVPQFMSLFDLALDVISKFKPSRLYLPICRVGPRSTDKLPEVQYRDEFYRSAFSVTSGNVRISPEFASARGAYVAGCIDFFIPVVKWGVEITRNGGQLAEHSSRFTKSGAYGAWLESGDINDYILLDCRTSIPCKPHPDPKLVSCCVPG